MKRVFILLAVFCSLQAGAQVWHDAADMHVFGKAVENTYGHYVRFPEDIDAKARKDLKYLGQDAAGLYVQFSTDSPVVHVRWVQDVEEHEDQDVDQELKEALGGKDPEEGPDDAEIQMEDR